MAAAASHSLYALLTSNSRAVTARTSLSSIIATPADETTRFDLEMSQPGYLPPVDIVEIEAVPSITQPYMNRFRLAAVCLMNFTNGLNDSAPGALLPYMEK